MIVLISEMKVNSCLDIYNISLEIINALLSIWYPIEVWSY